MSFNGPQQKKHLAVIQNTRYLEAALDGAGTTSNSNMDHNLNSASSGTSLAK